MEKKYQVFVSSTFSDLVEERKEVIQAILELDCFPVGMEMFPAADEDQWSLITRLIDDCDYYILILGGRYGSIGPEGISYTQMEYEYALSKKVPTIAFLPKNPEKIESGKTEKDPKSIALYREFQEKVKTKLCKSWNSPSELGSVVSRSLIKLIKDKPRVGWIKASNMVSEDAAKDLLKLKLENELLQKKLSNTGASAPEGSNSLSQGDDKVQISYSYDVEKIDDWEDDDEIRTVTQALATTWNEIFAHLSPYFLTSKDDGFLEDKLSAFCSAKTFNKHQKAHGDQYELDKFKVLESDWHRVKIQFRALGLIESIPASGKRDSSLSWSLTKYGDTVMTMLIAQKRTNESPSQN